MQWNVVVKEFIGKQDPGPLTHVDVMGTKDGNKVERIATNAAFIAIGHNPATSVFKDQLAMDKQGYLTVDSPSTWTSVPGVFAAGDISDKVSLAT